MKTVLEQIDFYNDEEFRKVFLSASLDYLSIIEKNNAIDSLKRIKYSKLKKVAVDLDSFSPNDKIRHEKKLFIRYLKAIISKPIADFSLEELLVLERDYILPIVDGKLREIGWTRRYLWFLVIIFTLPIDITLFLFISYYYVPLFSIYMVVNRRMARNKAKKENRLW